MSRTRKASHVRKRLAGLFNTLSGSSQQSDQSSNQFSSSSSSNSANGMSSSADRTSSDSGSTGTSVGDLIGGGGGSSSSGGTGNNQAGSGTSGGTNNPNNGNEGGLGPSPTNTDKGPLPRPTPTTQTTAPTSTATTAPTSTIPNATATSTSTAPVNFTSTASIPTSTAFPITSGGSTVYITNTAIGPTSTQGSIASGGGGEKGGSSPNVGAIIGGIAGGLIGIIVLCWLILIPVRKHAKRKRDVDWLSFKPDEHNHDEDTSNSIFRTPRAGVGEDDDFPATNKSVTGIGSGAIHGGEAYQMHEVHPGSGMGTLYGHLDGTQYSDAQQPPQVPFDPNTGAMYDPNAYAAYYGHHPPVVGATVQGYVHSSSPQTSPDLNAKAYYGGASPETYASQQPLQAPEAAVASAGAGAYGYGYTSRTSPTMTATSHPPGAEQAKQAYYSNAAPMPPQGRGNGSDLGSAAAAQPLSRHTSDSRTAFSHSGASVPAGQKPLLDDGYGSQMQAKISTGAQSSRSGVGAAMLQRRDSNKEMDQSDDLCLPYYSNRDEEVNSPVLAPSNQHLHLVNPDD